MVNFFGPVVEQLHETIGSDISKGESDIVFGTVVSIDPLEIEMTNGVILPSAKFYPLDAVLTKKVRFIVHRAYGKPKEVRFTGSANEVSNLINALLFNLDLGFDKFNLTGRAVDGGGSPFFLAVETERESDSGDFDISISGPPGAVANIAGVIRDNAELGIKIDGIETKRVCETVEALLSAKGDIAFRVDFIEEPDNEPQKDEHRQNQTTAIEGVIWQGMRMGDIVQMTSHHHNQKYQVSRIINRVRGIDDYEQASMWDSRVSDILEVAEMERVEAELPLRP